jgi:hypothetical protein
MITDASLLEIRAYLSMIWVWPTVDRLRYAHEFNNKVEVQAEKPASKFSRKLVTGSEKNIYQHQKQNL